MFQNIFADFSKYIFRRFKVYFQIFQNIFSDISKYIFRGLKVYSTPPSTDSHRRLTAYNRPRCRIFLSGLPSHNVVKYLFFLQLKAFFFIIWYIYIYRRTLSSQPTSFQVDIIYDILLSGLPPANLYFKACCLY